VTAFCYHANSGKTPHSEGKSLRATRMRQTCNFRKPKIRPASSQRYDHSAVIRLEITMAAWLKTRKPYDPSSGKSTMVKKDVTNIDPVSPGQNLLVLANRGISQRI